jgi:hypothetical protein
MTLWLATFERNAVLRHHSTDRLHRQSAVDGLAVGSRVKIDSDLSGIQV